MGRLVDTVNRKSLMVFGAVGAGVVSLILLAMSEQGISDNIVMGMPKLEKLEIVKASVPGKSVSGKGPLGLVLVEYGRGSPQSSSPALRLWRRSARSSLPPTGGTAVLGSQCRLLPTRQQIRQSNALVTSKRLRRSPLSGERPQRTAG